MIKLFKLMKNKENIERRFSNGLKINSGINRLVMLILGILYYQHLCTCLWIMLGQE